jgi:RNA polymerase sigma factor (sigma-70 family)
MPNHPPALAHTELVALLRRAQDGYNDAARIVFDRCRDPLLAVIRHMMQPRLRRLYDSEDFLLSAFTEIFTKHFNDDVLRGPETLWPYLKRIAENKVRDATRHHLASPARDLYRDVSTEDFSELLESKELSPCELLMLEELVAERLQNLLMQLPRFLKEIVQLTLDGHNSAEIAWRLRMEPKRVHRALDWLSKKVRET